MYNFIFNSEPKAIQSVRFRNAGKYIQTYQPKANVNYKAWIKLQAQTQLPADFKLITGAVAIEKCHFIFPILKSFPKYKKREICNGIRHYKTSKPDLADNLMKGLVDALTGIVWNDNSQIVTVKNTAKYYGEEPKIIMEIREAELVELI